MVGLYPISSHWTPLIPINHTISPLIFHSPPFLSHEYTTNIPFIPTNIPLIPINIPVPSIPTIPWFPTKIPTLPSKILVVHHCVILGSALQGVTKKTRYPMPDTIEVRFWRAGSTGGVDGERTKRWWKCGEILRLQFLMNFRSQMAYVLKIFRMDHMDHVGLLFQFATEEKNDWPNDQHMMMESSHEGIDGAKMIPKYQPNFL